MMALIISKLEGGLGYTNKGRIAQNKGCKNSQTNFPSDVQNSFASKQVGMSVSYISSP